MGVRAAAAAVALVAVMGMLAPRAAAQTPNCAAKLVPCSSYMNTTGTPPDTCCGPLKDAVKNDLKCLCDLYATPEIFKAFNISLDEALGLSKRCGLSDTTAACKGTCRFTIRWWQWQQLRSSHSVGRFLRIHELLVASLVVCISIKFRMLQWTLPVLSHKMICTYDTINICLAVY
ncbi:Bifunctional inhibitor/lipid-transfer protein/seed storage 2S albumin superfamily protein [Zea mays]|uniref:Bifunctional inhibitor/lipid-transfer protein/seed storage 2S albumin superfamily protein n=2 Tax=Zea mays TaxID=4577 RepID=A0A1D6GTY0_MAIZE|nr:Bifunctional inhibitor/lipid-transfer protein/seed storage 2S albumin superfamily protein [Zea mays]